MDPKSNDYSKQVFTRDGVKYTVTCRNNIVTAEKVVDESRDPQWDRSADIARSAITKAMRK